MYKIVRKTLAKNTKYTKMSGNAGEKTEKYIKVSENAGKTLEKH